MKSIKDIEEILEETDRDILIYFAYNLLKKEKYKKLREEIEKRREEIKRGEVLTHNEIWEKN